jgi:hypothetical protein
LLNEGIDRPLLKGTGHPIYTGRYLLSTNEINIVYDTVKRWIDTRAPGGIIYGRPRIGKTRAVKFLLTLLPTFLGNKLPVFTINCRHYSRPNENTFFQDLLRDIGHEDPFSGRASVKRQRLFNFLLFKGQQCEEKRIIFIMDEAHELEESHYGWLMDVYNELDRVNIDLTVILVGQKELLNRKSTFKNSNKKQIIGRFMVHEHEFQAITTIEDVHACLVGYDEETEFPPGSNFSFTRYFFPKAYEEGFRLANYTNDLFQAFINVRQAARVSGNMEIPMQYLTKTIEYVLITYGVQGHDVDRLSQNIFEESIQYSGYVENELVDSVV